MGHCQPEWHLRPRPAGAASESAPPHAASGPWQGAASPGPERAAAATGLPTPLAVARSGEGASGPGYTAFRVLLVLLLAQAERQCMG
jgi:hypothetical protein